MVRRHHLGGDAETPEAVTHALVALHATDPASVYLSVLARSTTSTLADVSAAMYERRTLVHWMAMRRTLFVLPRAGVPIVQAAISTPLTAMLRRRLLSQSQRELARRWLTRFGPATVDDLQWWTGWNKTTLRHALRELPIEEVDLHGDTGIALASDDPGDTATATPVAALLPALDPTPMGWKRRDWFFGIPQHHVIDSRGDIGPTLWWDGEIVGSWAVTSTGQVRTAVLADRGGAARAAMQDIATRLEHGYRQPRSLRRSAHR